MSYKKNIDGCILIEPKIFQDQRGFFYESFNESVYKEYHQLEDSFVQDNFSRSYKDVLRGLHFQTHNQQGKLVRVVKGEAFDVAVDLRFGSSTFGDWTYVILSEKSMNQFWIPPGFAHGFCALTQVVDFEYKCTNYYDPGSEISILWNDSDIGIKWPIENPIISDKDKAGISLNNFKNESRYSGS